MKPIDLSSNTQWNWLWIVTALVVLVLILELLSPVDFIFGYLYTGPVLLASARLSRKKTLQVTAIAIGLTILNLWIPTAEDITPAAVASRIIASVSLMVTALLGDRHRYYQEAIAQQQVKLQAQEQLVSIREDFASTLTHDLKTPILGGIETLKAFQKGKFGAVSPTGQKVLGTMLRSHQTSLQLLETLLDIYRNDTEGLILNLAPVDLSVLAEEVASTVFDLAASRRVHLSFSYGDSNFRRSLWVNGDVFQLQRVLSNLLINAINHSRRGDRVEIVLESQSSFQVVKILDTGSGFNPEELPNLFQRFYQGQGNRQVKGTGLGLYLSRQIVTAHGGTIWAENRHPTGALFGFKLPIKQYRWDAPP